MRVLAVVVAVLVACGDSGSSTEDASIIPTDVAVDAPWSVGTITVTIRYGSGGSVPSVADSTVIFTDAAQVTQVIAIDASGTASAIVTGPTTITHVQPISTNQYYLTTMFDAAAGDEVLLDRTPRNEATLAPIAVNYTAAPNTAYAACTACGCSSGNANPALAPMATRCQANPASVVLFAYAAGTTTYANGMPAYDPVTGGAITLAPSTATHTYSASFSSVPPEVSRIVFDFSAGNSSRAELQEGVRPNEQLMVSAWHGLAARFIGFLARSDYASQSVIEEVTQGATGFTYDAEVSLLPWLGIATYTHATRTLHAPSYGGAAAPDLFISTFG